MTDQMDLFCSERIKSEKQIRIEKVRSTAPDDIALIYTCTFGGKNSGGKYFMNIEDAQKFCSDDRTKGFGLGGAWAFFWTSLKNYFGNDWDLTIDGANFSNFFDDGRYKKLLDEMGITPIAPENIFLFLRMPE